jgi:hypothetical protein
LQAGDRPAVREPGRLPASPGAAPSGSGVNLAKSLDKVRTLSCQVIPVTAARRHWRQEESAHRSAVPSGAGVRRAESGVEGEPVGVEAAPDGWSLVAGNSRRGELRRPSERAGGHPGSLGSGQCGGRQRSHESV